ncbi:zinc finger protein 704-like isoform X2 [Pollicipes pollicipes]|uniref:zinc finger protein 704-like isoform X1 n=1 Tax=Pollicipes pollicipes TaxID=41117 RepID=UPI0018858252|nr:zinc finger protein 704-like isoform X1 [Pollicipes pollicipes]XP_037074040.1 zinc finger protein 704-like isoform X2 [Pollicipes pollicipes]
MSTGKRIAKRSILGTRVAACRVDGLYHTGVICGTKVGDGFSAPRYSVRFDGTRFVAEFGPNDLVGPGFLSVCDIELLPEQMIHVTHNGRETQGVVLSHRPDLDEVWIEIKQGYGKFEVKKRLEEVRLWESRKSPRLIDSDTDFARLADVGVEKRRSPGVDIPAAPTSSRKRRSSPSGWEEVGPGPGAAAGGLGRPVGEMTECTAAMVLMSLSASPKSPKFSYDSGPSWSDQMSIGSSGSETPSPPLSDVTGAVGSVDEGIDMDEDGDDRKRQNSTQTVFKCTWPGCKMVTSTCSAIEKHVRNVHLGRPPRQENSDLSDHEEEFYYTEVDVAMESISDGMAGLYASSPPTLSHMDMARPPHEDPQYQRELALRAAGGDVGAAPIPIPQPRQSWTPALWTTAVSSKYLRLGAKVITSSPKTSPHHRRLRGDVKKCRKVYGMEHREQWCTQCKWKKACTRFSVE